jgi:hypothetical protein
MPPKTPPEWFVVFFMVPFSIWKESLFPNQSFLLRQCHHDSKAFTAPIDMIAMLRWHPVFRKQVLQYLARLRLCAFNNASYGITFGFFLFQKNNDFIG